MSCKLRKKEDILEDIKSRMKWFWIFNKEKLRNIILFFVVFYILHTISFKYLPPLNYVGQYVVILTLLFVLTYVLCFLITTIYNFVKDLICEEE